MTHSPVSYSRSLEYLAANQGDDPLSFTSAVECINFSAIHKTAMEDVMTGIADAVTRYNVTAPLGQKELEAKDFTYRFVWNTDNSGEIAMALADHIRAEFEPYAFAIQLSTLSDADAAELNTASPTPPFEVGQITGTIEFKET